LARLPAAARIVVSGGCAGKWYFDWFDEHFPGLVERHYGVELFADPPGNLADNVVWLRQSLGSMEGIASAEADLVFGGEVIEHLWPDDIAAFLGEAWRVLRPGGSLALDSPNRIVVQALQWTHPEHTLEFSPAEIAEVLGLAGFKDVALRGVWLCYDRDTHRLLPYDQLDLHSMDREARVGLAEARPEDAFVWWAEATKGAGPPDHSALRERLGALYAAYRPERLARLQPKVPHWWDRELGLVAVASAGDEEIVFHGPYVPVPPGDWEACFRLSVIGEAPNPNAEVAVVDVLATGEPLASYAMTAGELPAGGAIGEITLPFHAERTRMGVEFRVIARGHATIRAPLTVTLRHREPVPEEAVPSSTTGAGPTATKSYDRRLRRLASWPLRRYFDPRFALLHRKIEGVEARLSQHFDDAVHSPATGPAAVPFRLGTAALPYNKVLGLEDFANTELADIIRDIHPFEVQRHGPTFPAGHEYRKHWEIAMAARTLRDFGLLHGRAEILGIGAGNEPTIFWLTNHIGRVFATDLYLDSGVWKEFANDGMLVNPGRYWPADWNPRRLVAQHMDARHLNYEDASFDAIFSSSSIEHLGTIDDVHRAMDEAHRVLKPGGLLSLTTEFRIKGNRPGLTGCLMFDADDIDEHLIGPRGWDPVDQLDTTVTTATLQGQRAQEDIVADFRVLFERHGELVPHELEFSAYPNVAVRFDDHVLTSVHLALRKR
jgi:ubiquinone/menaquinone biosynthesis C-methylase UbiE